MPSYNRTIIVGHLCRDLETRNVGESSVASASIAVNHKYTTKGGEKREDVLFLDFSAWGKTGEIIAQYARKGDAILLEGRLKMEQWEDKNGGGKRSKISLTVDNFQFLGGRPDGDNDQPARSSASPQTTRRPVEGSKMHPANMARRQPDGPVQSPFDDVQEFTEDQIPF